MATFKALQNCSKVRRFPVFGFIREQTKLLSIVQIPTVINYLCLAYYIPETDFFINNYQNDVLKFSTDQSTVTIGYETGHRISIYGYHWINSLSQNKHEWTFKINKMSLIMEFGLISSDFNHTTDPFINIVDRKLNHNIFVRIDGNKCIAQTTNAVWNKLSYLSNTNAKEIVLRLQRGRLSVDIDGNNVLSQMPIMAKEGVKYRIAATMRKQNDSITLKQYRAQIEPIDLTDDRISCVNSTSHVCTM